MSTTIGFGHGNYMHPDASRPITISGKMADDAKHYQIKAVKLALYEAKK